MRLLVDECTGPSVARWLRDKSHNASSVFDEARGLSDDDILAKALADDRVLITSDKDFGEMIYREKRSHGGVVLLRLHDQRTAAKIDALEKLLAQYEDRLVGSFVVVTESHVRFGPA